MSGEPPFGFTGGPPGEGDDERPGNADNPFAAMFGGAGSGDLSQMLHQFADLMAWQGGPVNWDLARQVAVQTAGGDDPAITAAQAAEVADAVRLAELWLDPVTALPAGTTAAEAWSRTRWVQETLPVWSQLCDPVAGRVVEAMTQSLPAEMAQMAGPLMGVMGRLGGMMFGTQVGQALGQLAGEVVGTTDIGLPLGPPGRAALLPRNIAAFGEGLGVPADQVRLYLALREAAHHRLFGHVPWLRAHLLEAVDAYGRGIRVDLASLESAVRDLDPTNPEALQEALAGGMLEPEDTPEQRAALARLETTLALIEGWVGEVVEAAAAGHLPAASALRETVLRRRASGGPAEQTFATLVGLELRPRRLRDAAALWRAVAEARGLDGRDAVWAHPDLLPGPDDLDDPAAFLHRDEPLDLSALDALTEEPPAEPPGEDRGPDPSG